MRPTSHVLPLTHSPGKIPGAGKHSAVYQLCDIRLIIGPLRASLSSQLLATLKALNAGINTQQVLVN